MTLVIDIALPFTTISILNAILISAIRNRNRNLETFGEGAMSNRSPAGMSITTERNYAGYGYSRTEVPKCEQKKGVV